MADKSQTSGCKKFSANVFHENKCQNCFKPKDVHQQDGDIVKSASAPSRPNTLELTTANRQSQRTTVKSGNLHITTQTNLKTLKWQLVSCSLFSSGDFEWWKTSSSNKADNTSILGNINLDECIGLTSAEIDTNEPFTIGIKTPSKTYYLKADNRLEMDNWCRVLKPFVIASPSYNFSSKSAATRTLSIQDMKQSNNTGSITDKKTSASRTVSAPWNNTTTNTTLNKRSLSASDKENIKSDTVDGGSKIKPLNKKQFTSKTMSGKNEGVNDTSHKYLMSDNKLNGILEDEQFDKQDVETQLIEAKRQVEHNQNEVEKSAKQLCETKKALDKANNLISIQKTSIRSLKSEVDRLKTSKDSGNTPKIGVAASQESGFMKLQAKLQENEEALFKRTQELEKANESRAKVAKHTRSLLLELESKLLVNNNRITELEEQLVNRTLELEYEKERGLKQTKEHSKQREISKKSTELLKQAKQDHAQLKNVHKIEQQHQEHIKKLEEQLRKKERELEQRSEEHADKETTKDSELKSLMKSLEQSKERCRKSEESLQQAKTNLEAHQKKYNDVITQNKKLVSDLNNIEHEHKNEVIKLEEINDNTSQQLQKMTEEIADLRSKKLSDQKQGEMRSNLEAELKETLGKYVELQKIHKETLEKLDKTTDRCVNLENTVVKKQDHELSEMKDDLKLTKEELDREKERVVELEKSVKDVNRLRETTNSYEKQISNLESKLLQANEQLGNERSTIDMLEEDLENMKKLQSDKESDIETTHNAEVEKLREELTKYEEELSNERNRIVELQQNVKDIEVYSMRENETVTDLEHKLKTARDELEIERQKYHTLQEEFQRLHDTYHEKTAEVDDILATNVQELSELQEKFSLSENKVVSLTEELTNQSEMKNEAMMLIEKYLDGNANEDLSINWNTTCLLECVQLLGTRVEDLEEFLKQEQANTVALEQQLNQVARKNETHGDSVCIACEQLEFERQKLYEELEEVKLDYATVLEKLEESQLNERKGDTQLHCEVNDKDKIQEQLKKELEAAKQAQQDLIPLSQEIARLSEENQNLERKLLQQGREQQTRKVNGLKSSYENTTVNAVSGSDTITPQLLADIEEKHCKEIARLQELHEAELETNKKDMMMVLQSLKSDSYQSLQANNDNNMNENDPMAKHERYIETLKRDHENEIAQLKEKHEQDLQQLRSDMVTLLRVQESYKSPTDEEISVESAPADLNKQLEMMRQSYERDASQKEEQHRMEIQQIREDMLVAIQAASVVSGGGSGAVHVAMPSSNNDSTVNELQDKIATMEKDFEEERETFQNTIKKAESATKFGLRRNEEMSNKIYQMQREMEEIDAKYQKEIKVYKEAFDEQKVRKASMVGPPVEDTNAESLLRVQIQELELKMEQMQVRYDGEIKRYKEKFQQENVLTVEELQLKIKSLEDSIEQMRLEHSNELERYTKAVKRGKVSLSGTAKERDLERKIDDLESRFEVMRQKHREEVRKYRERLEDEMERHRKEVSENKSKLRKLESDNRHIDDLKTKITEYENKTNKLTKELTRAKDMETQLNDTKSKNRDLSRQVDSLKRKLERLDEGSSEKSTDSLGRTSLQRYTSCDNVVSVGKSKAERDEDTFETNNNNSNKIEVGGFKLNPGLKRPASISSLPAQSGDSSVGVMRRTCSEKRRETSNRPYTPSRIASMLK